MADDGNGPIQIVAAMTKDEPVTFLDENLETVTKCLKAAKADYVSIISVMGTYRTGKSFLLDLLMRYLRHRASKEDGSSIPTGKQDEDDETVRKLHKEWKRDHGAELELPSWVKEGDSERISEGSGGVSSSQGFGWRGGKDKCTSGIWLWRKPFMFTDFNGRRIGVLLMDTQGAWDSELSQIQSSTIFGLTALLSSKLIYNIQNQVEEDKIANLDYFTTFAANACGAIDSSENGKRPFGLLQLLIRDWPNYEAEWNLAQCKKQMEEHMLQHLNPEGPAKERVERLNKCFYKMDCFGLTHPGLGIPRPNYDGNLAAIDADFFHLLDSFVEQLFGEDFPCPSAPLGSELTTAAFAQTVRNFGEAFANSTGASINLRDAFVKVQMMQERDLLTKQYKKWLEAEFPDTVVMSPEELDNKTQEKIRSIEREFKNKLAPFKLKQEESDECVNDLLNDLRSASESVKKSNATAVEGATAKIVATPVVGLVAWFAITHAWLIAIGACFAGWWSMKKHKAINKTDEMCHSAVIKGVMQDSKNFAQNRCRDVQAMQVAAQNLDPNKIGGVVMGAGLRAQAAVAKGMSENSINQEKKTA